MNEKIREFGLEFIWLTILIIVFVMATRKCIDVKGATVICNGKHNGSCYEEGVGLHQHTDGKGKTVVGERNKKAGGCFNDYHKGYHTTYDCNGPMEVKETKLSFGGWDFSCGCDKDPEALKKGVSLVNQRPCGVSYGQYGYTEYYSGNCSACGAGASASYNYEYIFVCSVCRTSCSPPGPHSYTVSEAAYYGADCGKKSGTYYYDMGNGAEAMPVCGRTVIRIEPEESRQICKFVGDMADINRKAEVHFKDGHKERVECTVSGLDYTKLNCWQEVNLCFGDYHIENNKNVRGAFEEPVFVYIQGTVDVSLVAENPEMGRPCFEDGEAHGEFVIGTTVKVYGNSETGYHFSGYRVQEEETNYNINDDGEWFDLKVPEYHLLLTLLYESNEYTVTLDASGGTFLNGNDKMTKRVKYGKVYGQTEIPVKDGYQFAGWSTGADCKETAENIDTLYDCVRIAEDHVLTAKWEENGPGYIFMSYDDTFDKLFFPSREGYDFDGWFLEEQNNRGTGIKADKQLPLKYEYTREGRAIRKEKDNYVIYATWSAQQYKLIFKCGERTYVSSSERDLCNTDEYNVTRRGEQYDSDRCSKLVTFDMDYGKLPVPKKYNKDGTEDLNSIFVGWTSDGTPDGIVTKDTQVKITHNLTLKPLFLRKGECVVTLNPNGGVMHTAFSEGIVDNPYMVQVGGVYGRQLGYYPTYENKVFTGWYLSRDGGGNRINTTSTVAKGENHSLYARWEKYVRYESNNVDVFGESLSGIVTGSTKRHIFVNDDEMPQKVRANGFYRPYYRFIGWNTKRDGSGTWYCNSSDCTENINQNYNEVIGPGKDSETVLYAQWDSTKNICLDYSGGNVDGEEFGTLSVRVFKKLNEKVDRLPKRDGFTFKGFYTGINGSGEKIYDRWGRYCYGNDDKKEIITVNPQTYVQIGKVVDSVLQSDSMAAITDLDKLYAYWSEGEEAGVLDAYVAAVNNEKPRRYKESVPVCSLGNKIDVVIEFNDENTIPDGFVLRPAFYDEDGKRLHAYSIMGKENKIVTYMNLEEDVYECFPLGVEEKGDSDGKGRSQFTIVIPYLTRFVEDDKLNEFLEFSKKNTISLNNPFFSERNSVEVKMYIYSVIQGDEVLITDKTPTVIICKQ